MLTLDMSAMEISCMGSDVRCYFWNLRPKTKNFWIESRTEDRRYGDNFPEVQVI